MKMVVAATALVSAFQVQGSPREARVAVQNASVRVYRTNAGTLTGVAHAPGVVIWLEDGPAGKAGRAMWLDDVAAPPAEGAGTGPIAIVQPLSHAGSGASTPASGSAPGSAPFTGMSFNTLFENARVTVMRARMDVGAREGFHTHASDTIVVHLSGGDIEDTADGKTTVNHWKSGDIEFEARGSSHSARNISHAVDVVLVALKP
jgi:quercetin dioxygenase-like cupin family protein